MGQMIGSTTSRGEEARDRPYRIPQVLSTIYHAIGINPSRTFCDNRGGRCTSWMKREPIAELI